jgi:hypothetical protein
MRTTRFALLVTFLFSTSFRFLLCSFMREIMHLATFHMRFLWLHGFKPPKDRCRSVTALLDRKLFLGKGRRATSLSLACRPTRSTRKRKWNKTHGQSCVIRNCSRTAYSNALLRILVFYYILSTQGRTLTLRFRRAHHAGELEDPYFYIRIMNERVKLTTSLLFLTLLLV